jgi:hypothetical protein
MNYRNKSCEKIFMCEQNIYEEMTTIDEFNENPCTKFMRKTFSIRLNLSKYLEYIVHMTQFNLFIYFTILGQKFFSLRNSRKYFLSLFLFLIKSCLIQPFWVNIKEK